MAGEGEEDVVETRALHAQVVDVDVGGVEGAGDASEVGDAGAARFAAYAAGQAACVGHVAEHDLGAAAYAIKAAQAGARRRGGEAGRRTEAAWQRDRIPDEVRALVLEDMARRNDLCWSVFDVSA